jgi:hypothetical protein
MPAWSRADDAVSVQSEGQIRFSEGLGRARSGNYEGARTSFTQAYALLHKPDILWNLALAEEKCGMDIPALRHFKEYARVATLDRDRQAASKHVEELSAKAGHLDVLAPSGAIVLVDDTNVGVAPLDGPIDVASGHHHVVMRVGTTAKSADADVTSGQLAHLSFATAEADTPPAAHALPVAGASAVSPPVAATSSDSGEAPAASNGSKPFWTPKVIVASSIGVAAIASGVAAFAFGRSSATNFNAAERLRAQGSCPGSPMCNQLSDKVNAQHDDFLASSVLWAAGGALLAGAVVTWFVWPNDSTRAGSATAISVTPTWGGGASAVVSGRF